jgi:hypothetical protein
LDILRDHMNRSQPVPVNSGGSDAIGSLPRPVLVYAGG